MSDTMEMTTEASTAEPSPPKRKRGRRLGSLANVKALLGSQIRHLEQMPDDELRPAERIQKARTVIYAASVLADAIRGDLDGRVRALEDLVAGRLAIGRH